MKSALIIQTAFIGDVILATPIIEKLHQHFPEMAIDFLVRQGNEALLEGHPKLRKVLIWHKKNRKYRDLLRLRQNIRREKYDYIINLQRFAAAGFLTAFSGADEKIGFDKNPLSLFFDIKIPHRIDGHLHEVERNLALIAHLTDSVFQAPVLYPSGKDFFIVKPYKSSHYICIAPSSVWFTKQLPSRKWVELLDTLPPSAKIYLLGSSADIDICEAIKTATRHTNIDILAGRLSLLQSAALMQGATMNYTNDSAPMHLASAMNAPITAVFCSTVPSFGFGPLSDQSFIVETNKKLTCRPCGLHGKKACPKGHFDCANTIDFTQDKSQSTTRN